MKKILVLICIVMFNNSVSADIINPDLSPEQLQKIREQRQKMYFERQRYSTINRVCGQIKTNKEISNCKKKLYDDYIETINFLEDKYIDVQTRKAK